MQAKFKNTIINEFNFIKSSKYKGIDSVARFDSGCPGPVLGVTINTHGNEPTGLGVLAHMRNVFDLSGKLKKGSVIVTLNNLKATKRYFKAIKSNDKNKAKDTRYVDVDMNRLPDDVLLSKSSKYEIARARELVKIWNTFDVALDIHDMAAERNPQEAIIIAVGKMQKKLFDGMPVQKIFSNIDKVQIGQPACALYGHGNIPVLGLEAGLRETEKSAEVGVDCLVQLLVNLKMIDGGRSGSSAKKVTIYKCIDSVVFPDSSYILSKKFKTFDKLRRGQVIATGRGSDIRSRHDAVIFSPIPKKKLKKKPRYEAMFLLSKI